MSEVAVKKGKPWSFYMSSITFSFERAAYYSSRWLLFTYVTVAVISGGMGESGLGLGKVEGAAMQSNIVAFTYLAPVLFGFIADRFLGARYLIPVGLLLMALGYGYAGYVGTYSAMWVMIVLVSIGTGFFKGNIQALVGRIFEGDQARKDDAFSTMYSFINIGSFVGTTFVGILYVKLATAGANGYLQCFKIAGLLCLIGAVWFVLGYKSLGEVGRRPFAEGEVKHEEKPKEKRPLQKYEVRRVYSIVIISLLSVIFWTFWYLTYVILYDYMPKFVDTKLGSFTVPTSWLDSVNGLCCIILGPILGALWYKLSKRPQGDWSLYKKASIALLLLGVTFGILALTEFTRGVGAPESQKASILWVILFFVVLSIAEMFFSPLGASFVSKYSPKSILSIMMAVWIVATFGAAKGYGVLYKFVADVPVVTLSLGIGAVCLVVAGLVFTFERKLANLVELREGETLMED
ncbi:transporter, major facilitator family protein [Gemella bergeri ATCC 700627]|uniref:Transporter, major facilitator family protein n=1 Tax=Gemella bergeri ATCC 700627 TaxID=1321820 RepID=U2QMA2_9BACL|nr:peptide MFS transporter [Gemella bergeri]ERK57349.1 transporter, major facilitator family protein [Gemella bergeri ATCC 700627]